MQGTRVQLAWLGRPDVRSARLVSGFFRAAFEQAADAMIAVATEGRVIDANPAACTLFELSRERMKLCSVTDLLEPNAQEGEGRVEWGVASRETVFVRSDGSRRTAEVTVRSDVLPGIHLMVIRDQTERQCLQAHLLRADRLSTFGMLAVGVAHEINNPLMYAMTNLRAVLRRLPDLAARARDSEAPELAALLEQSARMLTTADEGMGRIATLVRDLRISSRETESKERIDVRQVLESCLNIAHGEIRQRAAVVRDYSDVSMIEGNSGRLGQVFLNLLVNAAQAIPERGDAPGEIRITTRILDEQHLAVEISDNGDGIPPQTIGRIFEPFFTTKPAGEGTGLGLYIARSIVKDLGGEIEAESTVGIGTTMRVILPRMGG